MSERAAQPAGTGDPVPLCVDLDGTLVRSDTLLESVLALVRRAPRLLFALPVWLLRGRPYLKRRVAEAAPPDPASLPTNPALADLLRKERAAGRPLLLVTAAPERTATLLARHLGPFDDVLATDDDVNLKGRRKRDALVRRFGEGGFDYAGDSAADLEVWSSARRVITVNARRSVVRRVSDRDPLVLDPPAPRLRTVLDAMRVRQWVKNALVFLPALLAHRYGDPVVMGRAAVAFVSFGFGASAIYLVNDLLDLDADRSHPEKRRRPLAAGTLPLAVALAMIPILAAISLGLGSLVGWRYVGLLALYLGLTTAYSLVLKQIALVDVLVLAGLFTIRILAGSVATATPVSEWLLALSMFLFLSLGGVKRYAELRRVLLESGHTAIKGRGYRTEDIAVLLSMGLASGYISVLVMALYVTSDAVVQWYPRAQLLWLVCPLQLYWISRIWLLARRGEMSEDPVLFAVRDPATWLLAVVGLAVVLAAHMLV